MFDVDQFPQQAGRVSARRKLECEPQTVVGWPAPLQRVCKRAQRTAIGLQAGTAERRQVRGKGREYSLLGRRRGGARVATGATKR